MAAVNKKLKKEYNVYAIGPFEVNTEEYTLTIDGVTYGIASTDSENLILDNPYFKLSRLVSEREERKMTPDKP